MNAASETGRVVVRGVEQGAGEAEVFRARLPHGLAPRRLLREASFKALALTGFTMDGDDVVLTYDVARMRIAHHRPSGMPRAEQDVEVTRQRLAAYAVVTSREGVLLTQLSVETGRPGLWILPGGGVDDGEAPDDAVIREVWEETGQQVELAGLVDVSSAHRIGPGRRGLVEDFHAVRLVFRAVCADPQPPVVHDVGGSTAAGAWFPLADVVDPTAPGYPQGGMAPWALDAVRAFGSHRV